MFGDVTGKGESLVTPTEEFGVYSKYREATESFQERNDKN